MQLKSSIVQWAIVLFLPLVFSSCKKYEHTTCSEESATASFLINNQEFNSLEEKVWLRTGSQNSLLFMQEQANGNQHVVNVIFNGDTAGTYPLQGINGTHRLSYFAPGVNATTFEPTVVGGLLEITNLDEEPGCLSGSYTFEIDTLQISGEFKSLRAD